jgi:hypothetical protein
MEPLFSRCVGQSDALHNTHSTVCRFKGNYTKFTDISSKVTRASSNPCFLSRPLLVNFLKGNRKRLLLFLKVLNATSLNAFCWSYILRMSLNQAMFPADTLSAVVAETSPKPTIQQRRTGHQSFLWHRNGNSRLYVSSQLINSAKSRLQLKRSRSASNTM